MATVTESRVARSEGAFRLLLGGGLEAPVRRAYLAVVLLGCAGVAGAFAAAFPWQAHPFLQGPVDLGALLWPATAGFAVLFFLLEKHGFVFHWAEESTKVSLDEIALFLGVVFLPPGHVVLGAVASAVLNQWLHRRDPAKAAFNVAQYAAGATLAALAAAGLRALGVPSPWFALAAPVVFAFATCVLVCLLFAAMQQASVARVYRDRFGTFAFVGASLGISLGVVALALYTFHPFAVLAAVPVFMYLRRFGRLSEWADDELKTHKLLAGVGAQLAGSADLDAVAGKVLTACHQLFDCGEAHLTITTPEPPRTWRRAFVALPSGHGGITTPLLDGQGAVIGQLTAFPKPGQRAYGEREHHLLSTVAANASAAAANARALQAAEDANRDLVASEGRYHHLFETALVHIHLLDEEGGLLDANPAARAALGPHALTEARSFDDLIIPTDPTDPFLARLRRDGEVRGYEATLRTAEGEEMVLLIDAKSMEIPGQAGRYVAFARDITFLKALESDLRDALAGQKETIRRLENMNRELEEFTLWTTHDMREPLRSIGTIAELLHEDVGSVPPEEAKDMARRIHQGAERLKERVKALHAFSRIVQQDDEFSDVDLQAVVEEVVTTMEATARERGATIHLPAERFPVVRAQPHRLHQVIANLVENAIKYSTDGPPRVELGFEETPEGWCIHVQDDGPGIPPSYHDRIFQLFQRGPDHGQSGSGAGLAIVKRIVDQHGGRVWVKSQPGQGARFSFLLPKKVQPTRAGTALAALGHGSR